MDRDSRPASTPPTAPAERLGGRYRLGTLIGHGGMAEVVAAFDESLQRPVAVKRLRAEYTHDADLRRRFVREAGAAGRITHPNVVAIYDVGEHDGVPYFVMERLPGRTLHDEIGTGPIPQPRLRILAAEILGGLGAAHRLGILHRVVKPGNVLLDETGRAKVGDFGIAHVSDDMHHTTAGLVLGTLSYLPPERLAGGVATPAGDLYGVGVLLFEAATGRAAFRAESPLALTHAVATDLPTFGVEDRRRLDPGFVRAVERAMAKEPADRFPSTDAMLAALLDEASAGPGALPPTLPVRTGVPPTERLPTDARPVGTSPSPASVRPPTRRRRWLLLAAALVVVALGALTAVAVLAGSDPTSTPPPIRTPSTRTPPGSTPPQLGRSLDGLDQAIDR